MKVKLIYTLFFTVNIFAQNVNIPDANFKIELLTNTTINTNLDGEIQLKEAYYYGGVIDVANKNIDDLTGIEAFVNISGLNCSNNYLSNLNLSANTNLRYLNCRLNELISLDVSKNTKLNTLLCNNNDLINLDITTNTSLNNLNCSYNNLTNLNLANKNNALIYSMNAKNNTNLSCIQIDAGFIVTDRINWQKDREANYSKDCSIIYENSNNKELKDIVRTKENNKNEVYLYQVIDELNVLTNNIKIKEIEIYNIFGKKVIATTKTNFKTSSLPIGIYFLKIRSTNDLVLTKKFVKK